MRGLSQGLLLTLALTQTAPAMAECGDADHTQETLLECWTRYSTGALNGLFAAGAKDAASEAQKRLLDEPVGTAVGVAQTVVQNFLPYLSLAGLGLGKGDDSSAIRIDGNAPLLQKGANNTQLRLAAIPKPELSQLALQALSDAAGGVVEDLKSKLGPTDDYTGQISFSLNAFGFGRNLADYRDEFSGLLAGAFPGTSPDFDLWFDDIKVCFGETNVDALNTAVAAFKRGAAFRSHQQECERALADLPDVAQKQVRLLKDYAQARQDAKLDRFADLVSNQPALTVSGFRTQRDPLVGSSFWGARVSFEMGFYNLHSFEHAAGPACDGALKPAYIDAPRYADADKRCLDAFTTYITQHADRLREQNRVAAWIEYDRLQDLHLQVPQAGVDLRIDGASRIAAGLGVGHVLFTEGDGRSTRIDLFGRYDHFVADSVRLDHAMYSVVLTQRLGALSVPFVLAYADRSEFKAGPTGLTATLGLSSDFGLPDAPDLDLPDVAHRLSTRQPTMPALPTGLPNH